LNTFDNCRIEQIAIKDIAQAGLRRVKLNVDKGRVYDGMPTPTSHSEGMSCADPTCVSSN